MKPLILNTKKFNNKIKTVLKVNRITFEGLYNYKENDNNRTVNALFYLLVSDEFTNQKIIPFYVMMLLSDNESIEDFNSLKIIKPVISSELNHYIMIDVPNKKGSEYYLNLQYESDESEALYEFKLGLTEFTILEYILQCLYDHKIINTGLLNDLYKIKKNNYLTKRVNYTSFRNDVEIDKIFVDKRSGIVYSFIKFKNKNKPIIVLFQGLLNKKQIKLVLRKFKNSIRYINNFETFKSYGMNLEADETVYSLQSPIIVNYRTAKGAILYKEFFINHYYKTVLYFMSHEFEKFLEEFADYITK